MYTRFAPRSRLGFRLWKLAMLLQAYLGLKDRREVEAEIRLAKLEIEFNALFIEVLSEIPELLAKAETPRTPSRK